MKNTHCQPSPWTKRPPQTDPTMAAMPLAAPKMPSARFRSGPSTNVRDKNGERVRRRQRCAEPLARTGGDKDAERAGQAADQRRRGQHADAGNEHLAMTDEVAGAPPQQQESRHDHAVGDNHPLEIGRLDVQVSLDRRECDVDHRQVEHRHRPHTAHQARTEFLDNAGAVLLAIQG
jgi:hypothetical protein